MVFHVKGIEQFMHTVAKAVAGLGVVGAVTFGGYKVGEATQNTTPAEYAEIDGAFVQAKADMIATAGGRPCQVDKIAALANTAELPKIELTPAFFELVLNRCEADKGAVNHNIAVAASEKFGVLVSSTADRNNAVDNQDYDSEEKFWATGISLVGSTVATALILVLSTPDSGAQWRPRPGSIDC